MRIIAGRLRGLSLAPLPEGDEIRPTSDKVRGAIFNLLAHGPYGDPVTDARVLDLFAGTGALGLEALSRGAANVTFVDKAAPAGALIRRNIELARSSGASRHFRRDATQLGSDSGAPFSLVFLDPPYGLGLGEKALASAIAGGWLAPGAIIVWEEGAPPGPPPGFSVLDQRRYGDTLVTVLRAPG